MPDNVTRSSLQVPFGLKADRLYEPLQVENGRRCNCTCPGCGAALIAKHAPLGGVSPHFAHATKAACVGGIESALHLAAKQLIADRRALYLPELVASISAHGKWRAIIPRSTLVHKGVLSELQDVRLEVKVGAIRPDLIVNTRDREILVEIANTSFVTPEKLEHIRRQGVATIEVDVSHLVLLNFEELAKRLFAATSRSTWKYHPELAAHELALQPLLDADLAEDLLKWELAQENEARKLALQRQREAQAERDRLKIHRIRAQQLARDIAVPPTERLAQALAELGPVSSDINMFLPIPVRGAMSINASPLIWQAAAFAALVHPALKHGKSALSADQVRTWLSERFRVDTLSNSLAVAVWYFLIGLADLEILHKVRKQEFIVAVPNIEGALAVATDVMERGTRELVWCETWPGPTNAKVVANVFAGIYGYRHCWDRLAGLLPDVRHAETPAATMAYYKRPANGAMDAAAIRRYFLSAGFAQLSD